MKQLKKLTNAIFLTMLLLPGFRANAQQATDDVKANIIKWNPISLAFSTLSLSYERRLSPKLSIEGTINLTALTNDNNNSNLFSNNTGYYGTSTVNATGFVLDLKYYATYQSMKAPTGFFIGPFIRYMAMSYSDDSTAASGTRTTIGANIGYQLIGWNVVSVEIFGGPAYEIIKANFSKQANGYTYNSLTGNTTESITLNDILSRYDPLSRGVGNNIGFRCGFTIGVAF